MKVPINWLKEYVKIAVSDEELIDKLTMSGLEVTKVETTALGKVLEIEVTTNRFDWLSIIGLAREIDAIYGQITLKTLSSGLSHKGNFNKLLPVTVLDRKNCPRYTARIIEGVKVESSPQWLKEKIESAGLRPICNIVDITNFVLFEYGQPLHAFDMDKLEGRKITVRTAKKGEKIVTIDNIKRELEEDILIIADDHEPVAIAGIMGGKSCEVTTRTKNILLESAYFDALSVRRSSRKLGLTTDSSYRFERGVDWQAVKEASDRAAELIRGYAGGIIRDEFFDSQAKKKILKRIKLNTRTCAEIAGVNIEKNKIVDILKPLGVNLKGPRKKTLEFEIPSYRPDLKREVDLIEELVRLWGYDKIPVELPLIKPSLEFEESNLIKLQSICRDVFVSLGFNEAVNYSLVSRDVLKNLRVKSEEIIALKNPLSSELEVLRPRLLPSIVQNLSFNLNRRIEQVKIFELAHVYFKKGENIEEKLNLGFGLSGLKHIDDWQNKPKNIDFFDLKGTVEVFFEKLGISNFTFSQDGILNLFEKGSSAVILRKEKTLGFIGTICAELLEEFDINVPLYAGEIYLENLLPLMNFEKKFTPFSPYPFIVRDAAILISKDIPACHILSVMKKTGGEMIKDIRLFDRYSGRQIPEGFVSLAFSIRYQSAEKTLTDEEVNKTHSDICFALREELKAQLR